MRASAMTLGEFETATMFFSTKIPYYHLTYTFFIFFMLIMAVMIVNLLVGLAVDNIKVAQEKAEVESLSMQTALVLDLERTLWGFLYKMAIQTRVTYSELEEWLFSNYIEHFKRYWQKGSTLSVMDRSDAESPEVSSHHEQLQHLRQELAELKSAFKNARGGGGHKHGDHPDQGHGHGQADGSRGAKNRH